MTDRKILVAVDLQNDFIDGALGTKEAEAIVPACAPFVPLAQDDISQRRERKDLIISFPRYCTCFRFPRRYRHNPPACGEE